MGRQHPQQATAHTLRKNSGEYDRVQEQDQRHRAAHEKHLKSHPAKPKIASAQIRRELQRRKYPYSNFVLAASAAALIAIVGAVLYHIGNLAPTTAA